MKQIGGGGSSPRQIVGSALLDDGSVHRFGRRDEQAGLRLVLHSPESPIQIFSLLLRTPPPREIWSWVKKSEDSWLWKLQKESSSEVGDVWSVD
ncbi:hypothetical protein Bca4012_010932 [Brassica carinata]